MKAPPRLSAELRSTDTGMFGGSEESDELHRFDTHTFEKVYVLESSREDVEDPAVLGRDRKPFSVEDFLGLMTDKTSLE